jgi:hypothetical protein
VPEVALNPILDVVEVQDRVLHDPVHRVHGADGDDDVHDLERAVTVEEPIGDGNDGEEKELLAVPQADLGLDREDRGHERRPGIDRQRPEHIGNFDSLVVHDHEREPQHGREREQDAGGGNGELRCGGEAEQRDVRRPFEQRRAPGRDMRRQWRCGRGNHDT